MNEHGDDGDDFMDERPDGVDSPLFSPDSPLWPHFHWEPLARKCSRGSPAPSLLSCQSAEKRGNIGQELHHGRAQWETRGKRPVKHSGEGGALP